MSKEVLKTIVLTVLVLTSMYLTWGIWTYAPNSDSIDEQNEYLKTVSTPSSEELGEIIKPFQIIYSNGYHYYGSTSESIISEVIDKMSNWDIYDLDQLSSYTSAEKLRTLSDEKGMIDLVFLDQVPFAIYGQVLNLEENDLSDENFDRMLISSRENRVYFIESDESRVYYGHVKASSVQALVEQMNKLLSDNNLSQYKALQKNENMRPLYVPAKETDVNVYNYFIELINTDTFKETLFEDPSIVTQEATSLGTEYTDNKTNLLIYDETLTFSYIKPNFNNNYDVSSSSLLEQSLRFMTDKGSWEKNYHLDEVNTNGKSVSYRLYLKGLPVFNNQGMSEMKQIWNKNDIHFFSRPTFTLDFSLPGTSTVTLPSGEAVYRQLINQAEIDSDLLECLTIGYKMSRDNSSTRMVVLEPFWYYKYDGQWIRFTSDDEAGGIANGLE